MASSSAGKTALVVSAHSADFVWRAGGAIALHTEQGFAVTVICLSYGERGESAKLWNQPGMTLERVKVERQKEAEAAARHLGVTDIQFWDLGDYPSRCRTTRCSGSWTSIGRSVPPSCSRIRPRTSTTTTTQPSPISPSTRASWPWCTDQ